ncbi:hypothetical protein HNO89_000458 [Sporosarcina luteola]|nr:hypothetical protein [Sporosarcina luteola]
MEKKKYVIKFRTLLIPFIALLLITLPLQPTIGHAASTVGGGEIQVDLTTGGLITEETINSGSNTIALTLNDRDWARVLDKSLIIQSMVADVENDKWTEYKKKITEDLIEVDGKKLTIKLPNDVYSITQNQKISFNLNAAVIEDWPGTVSVVPASFTIYAKPELSIEGTIKNGTTIDDIRKGGKVIDLVLLNATWNQNEFVNQTRLYEFLEGFNDGSGGIWGVVGQLKKNDPNLVYEFINDSTLRIKLPAIPNYPNADEVISFQLDDGIARAYYTIDSVENDPISSNLMIKSDSFSIHKGTMDSINAELVLHTSISEKSIRTTNTDTITLRLSGGVKWNIGNDAAKKVLIESSVAKKQPEEWEKIKNSLLADLTKISITQDPDPVQNNTEVTITIPKLDSYYLTADQPISLKVPYQLLTESVPLKEQSFTITAQPKVLISGTATPTVSQADIVKGNKTVVLTLVNSTWDVDVATNSQKREMLLSSFTGFTGYENIMNARAGVVRNSNSKITITLPALAGYKSIGDINYSHKAGLTTSTDFNTSKPKAFTVTEVENQSAVATGTITNKVNEFDIAKGGQELILTLKNDMWVKDVESKIGVTPITITGQRGDLSALRWDIVRKSDTILSMKLMAVQGFGLTDDTVVDVAIPKDLLALGSKELKVDSAFTIYAVKADVSGNGTSMDFVDVQKGKKKLVISLKNANFDIEAVTVNAVKELLKGSTSTGSADWVNKVVSSIDDKSVKVTSNQITITLPAAPTYSSNQSEEITLAIGTDLIKDANKPIQVDGAIKVGSVATASVNPGTLSDSGIKSGIQKITITLNGADWDPTIETNTTKKTALLNGFKTNDQTKEWTQVINEVKKSGTFKLEGTSKLTITIPQVPSYSIIRSQEVNVTVPKSVLTGGYKYDIDAGMLRITVPPFAGSSSSKTFADLLSEGIDATDLEKTRIYVPEKKVQTIVVNTTDVPGAGQLNNSITTVEITTNNEVDKVEVAVVGQETMEANRGSNGKFLFVFSNVEKNAEMKVSVYGQGGEPLQADIYKKLGKGSKTYNELPKQNLTGSYSLYDLLTNKSLLTNILKYYTIEELFVQE